MPEKLDDITLRSESVQEILSTPPNWMIRWGISIVFLVLLLLLVLSWFVKYPDFVSAEVLITTQNPPEKIEARINGKIETLLVKNQDPVTENQILAIIQNPSDNQDMLKLIAVTDSLKINDKEFTFPFALFQKHAFGDVESDYIDFEQAYTAYALTRKLQPFAPETLAGNQSLHETNSRLVALQKQKNIEKAKLALVEKDLRRSQSLFEQGVISAQEMEKQRLEHLQAQQNLQNIDLSISQLKENKNTIRKGLAGNHISKQQTETEQLKSLLQAYGQLKKSLIQWQQTYLLRSSIVGTVSFQNLLGTNQYVKTGEVLFSVLPKQSHLTARLSLPIQNSGKVLKGNKVNIKLYNYPYQEYGIIKGKIKSISASDNSDGNYIAEAQISDTLTTSYGKRLVFDKELRGSAEVITEDLRLIERFFYQFRKLFRST